MALRVALSITLHQTHSEVMVESDCANEHQDRSHSFSTSSNWQRSSLSFIFLVKVECVIRQRILLPM
jgi:hypothetical protein